MKITSLNKNNILSSMKFVFVIPFAILSRLWRRDIWIITERSTQARDNGYCFFRYLRERYSEYNNIYYIIDKKSEDYQKIEKYGNVIQFDSWKHYFYYCLSRVHISAHVNGCCPSNAPICRRIKRLLKVKDVFIPHGVSYGISEFCLKKYAKIDLFICSGKPEYDNVLNNYGYNEQEVVYTGFPRLDGWHNIRVISNQILLMPTWRLYLAQNEGTVFEETRYYKAYQSFIQDKQLSDFLTNNNLTLVFYLHNDMQKYVDYFKSDCPNIEIVCNDSAYDIQELLKSSALLITDYSSVHFDFAYMKKPVLYYQFDKEEFFERQYQKGSFDAERDGFGSVVYDKNNLVLQVERAYENDFKMNEFYLNRMRVFYQIYDDKNCERVFQEIVKRIEKEWF